MKERCFGCRAYAGGECMLKKNMWSIYPCQFKDTDEDMLLEDLAHGGTV